jgi:putative Holliday junction resolvase
MIRYLGLDVGDATVGLAMSDPLGYTAQGLENYRRVSVKEDVSHIVDIIEEYHVTKLVVGQPLNMNGSKGPQAEKVEVFVKQIVKKIKHGGKIDWEVQVVHWDERLTTTQVEKMMITADLSRAKRKSIVDKMAAMVILQSYLDGGN